MGGNVSKPEGKGDVPIYTPEQTPILVVSVLTDPVEDKLHSFQVSTPLELKSNVKSMSTVGLEEKLLRESFVFIDKIGSIFPDQPSSTVQSKVVE
ncbi:MAG: hypothetical protein BWK79_18640 [Beggiatoa sp. IS2]|nr:MAG: hypothetical protein BWK79_18640 [Beggiatoa sp. IS2]